ncbi:hypothetical protein ABFS83_04G041300 [Erythranthe nasuta]
MASLPTTLRYLSMKFKYSLSTAWKSYAQGQIREREFPATVMQNLRHGKMTFLHTTFEKETTKVPGASGHTFLVRKIPSPTSRTVRANDLVVLKDPNNPSNYIVRRLAATKSNYTKPFVLGKNQCWVLADKLCWELVDKFDLANEEAYDSRTFGPVNINNIVGRAIYAVSIGRLYHETVYNNLHSVIEDFPVVEVELNIQEMESYYKPS